MSIPLFALAMIAWGFLAGMIAGINLAERRKLKKATMDTIFEEGRREIETVEKFAGAHCISRNIIVDLDGSKWLMSIEREKA